MAEQLTPQQKQAVTNRNGRLLVSAAAGSGKTKVLVDRLMSYINDPADPANLDDFLIITYTKAAAAELRGKIAAKLTEHIAADPENRHLQRQLQRLYLAKISTVHSFCSDILREFAYRLDLSADFRMIDEVEATQLQIEAMEQVLDRAYDAGDSDFYAFIDTQGLGRSDYQVPQIVLEVYEKSRCHLDPEKWLADCVAAAEVDTVTDAAKTPWGDYLMQDLKSYLDMQIEAIGNCVKLAENTEFMDKPRVLLADTYHQLCHLRDSKTWNDVIARMKIEYGTLTFDKKCDAVDLIAQIKAVRNNCKTNLPKKLKPFTNSSEQILRDLSTTAAAARGLAGTVRAFGETYGAMKRSRHVVDFSDLEHQTLNLLAGKSRIAPTAAAHEIGSRFREVMVDEYQDSNAVQDCIFRVLTEKRQNCFMVGDVKQSIYQFRLADPGIFLQKYKSYVPADNAETGQGRKIMLSSNFRSSGGVISAVNCVFETCMSDAVGGLAYGEDEALREGIPHTALPDPEVELYAVDVQESTYPEEAAFVADRIHQLLRSGSLVRDKDQLRPVTPDDIVILLRSPGSVGGYFRSALECRGIRCSTGSSSDLLQTEEISVLRSILQIINNPQQDIPLMAAVTSRVFGLSADDIASVRVGRRSDSLFDTLNKCEDVRVAGFLETLSQLRQEARVSTLTQVLNKVMELTKLDSIYRALPDGNNRVENIQTLCQLAASMESNGQGDLGRFLIYLDSLEVKGFAVNEENGSGTVRIMSIHKSKGLEFPVVFLCGLSKSFNTEDFRAPVLCERELGFGLCCAQMQERIKYPTIAKNAIAAKMAASNISEELRVLYVAMTRAKDRLIMTHAQKKIEACLMDYALRMDISPMLLLTSTVSCAGDWVLMSALRRAEAKAFHSIGARPTKDVRAYEDKWHIDVVYGDLEQVAVATTTPGELLQPSHESIQRIERSLQYTYSHGAATQIPSKQTATQLKGRLKDTEAAEGTFISHEKQLRRPSFAQAQKDPKAYGNAMHAVMQHIRYESCTSLEAVEKEIRRLVGEGTIPPEQGELANAAQIYAFFAGSVGNFVRNGKKVLREFKFSILEDCGIYYDGIRDEQILLQGVVDCAVVAEDGLYVYDFKTDYVTEETLPAVTERYRSQVLSYARALERIFQKPVKSAELYFFRLNKFVPVK